MVTANVDRLASSFERIIQNRDVESFAAIGVAGASGGAIGDQISQAILPRLGFNEIPTGVTGLAASGLTKMLIGAAMGYGGYTIGGTAGDLLMVGGLGSALVGGGDWVTAGLEAVEGPQTQQVTQPARQATQSAQRATAQVTAKQPAQSSPSASRADGGRRAEATVGGDNF